VEGKTTRPTKKRNRMSRRSEDGGFGLKKKGHISSQGQKGERWKPKSRVRCFVIGKRKKAEIHTRAEPQRALEKGRRAASRKRTSKDFKHLAGKRWDSVQISARHCTVTKKAKEGGGKRPKKDGNGICSSYRPDENASASDAERGPRGEHHVLTPGEGGNAKKKC